MHQFIEKDLIELGYKTFNSNYEKRKYPNSYVKSYQKRIADDLGKKYFITLHETYEEDINKKYNRSRSNFETDCQFYIEIDKNKEETFDVNYFISNNPDYVQTYIEEMEVFFENLWTKLGCRYYEKWSES